ncbi:hypothetical protein L6452_18824 [Arctium lappa]|uniref:Uncharacterized protein n=1 Tax=Arctium lappa TaxID=4217 RepID=A0ACB9C7A3_ARCLA|nr:hypothetical protein L6452_18824 [Arctium lappa]
MLIDPNYYITPFFNPNTTASSPPIWKRRTLHARQQQTSQNHRPFPIAGFLSSPSFFSIRTCFLLVRFLARFLFRYAFCWVDFTASVVIFF